MVDSVRVESVEQAGAEVEALFAALDKEMLERYPEPSLHPVAPEQAGVEGAVIVARAGDRAVGCGMLRPLTRDRAEIKRMYVDRAFRRHGLARRILEALERAAQQSGYRELCLETGTKQPEAIALYEGAGFRSIPPFGEYVNDPFSVCFQKNLF